MSRLTRAPVIPALLVCACAHPQGRIVEWNPLPSGESVRTDFYRALPAGSVHSAWFRGQEQHSPGYPNSGSYEVYVAADCNTGMAENLNVLYFDSTGARKHEVDEEPDGRLKEPKWLRGEPGSHRDVEYRVLCDKP